MINPNCPICRGLGWVCENHPYLAWTKDRRGCQCGAGMPCACNGAGIDQSVVSLVGWAIEVTPPTKP